MKRFYILLAACSAILFSCNTKTDKTITSVLNRDNLQSQFFGINIHRDTTLLTKSGCIIRIPKESLESDSTNVKLEIKEALSNTDIVLGGLTTMSGSNALSSGGMIYINAATGYKVGIKKSLEVLIPTKDYNPNMSIFKGEDSAGKINWKNPEPLPNDSTLLSIRQGEAMFKANCASCHKVSVDFTGPALAGVTQKRRLSWLYKYIHDPAGMTGRDAQAREIADRFKPTIMTAFPLLSKSDINNILAYTSTFHGADKKVAGLKYSENSVAKSDPCADSCMRYINALNDISFEAEKMEDQDFFTIDRDFPIPPQTNTGIVTPQAAKIQPVVKPVVNTTKKAVTITPAVITKETDWVKPAEVKATMYTVNIKAFGWYNVDVLCGAENTEPSELLVHIQGNYENDIQVMLIIPSLKAFIQGDKADDGEHYAFREVDGKIPLPQNVQCYIIAFAETNGKIVFGKKDFISSTKQSFDIALTETTKQGLTDSIASLKLDGVTAEVKDSEKAENLKILQKRSAEAEKLKPVNCNCSGLARQPARVVEDVNFENLFTDADSLTASP